MIANAVRHRIEIRLRAPLWMSDSHPSNGLAMTAPMPNKVTIEPAVTGEMPYCLVISALPHAPNPTVAHKPPHPAMASRTRLRLFSSATRSAALIRGSGGSPLGASRRTIQATSPQASVMPPNSRKAVGHPYHSESVGTEAFVRTTASDVAVV